MAPDKPPDADGQRKQLIEATFAIEFIAKYGGAIGLTALGTAFLYDALFWWIVDVRVLGYYGVADHVETAVRIFAVLLPTSILVGTGLTAIVVASIPRRLGDPPLTARKRIALHVALGATAIIMTSLLIALLGISRMNDDIRLTTQQITSFHKEIESISAAIDRIETHDQLESVRARHEATVREQPTTRRLLAEAKQKIVMTRAFLDLVLHALVAIVISFAAGIVIGLLRPRTPLTQWRFRFALVVWVVTTSYLAIVESVFIDRGIVLRVYGLVHAPQDTLSIENDRILVGSIVRVLDRGVTLRDNAGSIMFIPKDRVLRAEFQR